MEENNTESWESLLLIIFIIAFGISLIKTGVEAIKEQDKGTILTDPRFGLPAGILCLLIGLSFLIKFFIIPMFE